MGFHSMVDAWIGQCAPASRASQLAKRKRGESRPAHTGNRMLVGRQLTTASDSALPSPPSQAASVPVCRLIGATADDRYAKPPTNRRTWLRALQRKTQPSRRCTATGSGDGRARRRLGSFCTRPSGSGRRRWSRRRRLRTGEGDRERAVRRMKDSGREASRDARPSYGSRAHN
jgi:hypothetical protein